MFATFIRPVLLRMALEAAFGIGQVILAPATNSVPLATGEARLQPAEAAAFTPSQAPVGMGWG